MSLLLEISEKQVVALLSQMPPEQRARILAHFSTSPVSATGDTGHTALPERKPRRIAGKGKDHIRYIAEDFDAPLEDMKEYM